MTPVTRRYYYSIDGLDGPSFPRPMIDDLNGLVEGGGRIEEADLKRMLREVEGFAGVVRLVAHNGFQWFWCIMIARFGGIVFICLPWAANRKPTGNFRALWGSCAVYTSNYGAEFVDRAERSAESALRDVVTAIKVDMEREETIGTRAMVRTLASRNLN